MVAILHIVVGRFIKAVANTENIIPVYYRLSLIRNWLGTITKLISYTSTQDRFQGSLEGGIIAVADTLSFEEQEEFYVLLSSVNPCIAFEWWTKKLHHAYCSTN